MLVLVRKRAEIRHSGAWTAGVRARGGGAHPILRVGVISISKCTLGLSKPYNLKPKP